MLSPEPADHSSSVPGVQGSSEGPVMDQRGEGLGSWRRKGPGINVRPWIAWMHRPSTGPALADAPSLSESHT